MAVRVWTTRTTESTYRGATNFNIENGSGRLIVKTIEGSIKAVFAPGAWLQAEIIPDKEVSTSES